MTETKVHRTPFEQLEEIVHFIDIHTIDAENQYHAGYLYDSVCYTQEAYLALQNAKLDFEALSAKALMKVVADEKAYIATLPEKEKAGGKTTDPVKKAKVESLPEVLAAAKAVSAKEAHYERCLGLQRSFSARNKTLEKLTDLVLGKFTSMSKA